MLTSIIIFFLLLYLLTVVASQFLRSKVFLYPILAIGIILQAVGIGAEVLYEQVRQHEPLHTLYLSSSIVLVTAIALVLFLVWRHAKVRKLAPIVFAVSSVVFMITVAAFATEVYIEDVARWYNIIVASLAIITTMALLIRRPGWGPTFFLIGLILMGIGGGIGNVYSETLFSVSMVAGVIFLILGIGQLEMPGSAAVAHHVRGWRLFQPTINTKILLGFLTVSLVPIIVISYINFNTSENYLIDTAVTTLGDDVTRHASEISLTLEQYRSDVIFLSNTPPIQGMIRAQQNDGFDEQGGSTYDQWRERLQEIFIEKVEGNLDAYMQIRYLDATGMEIVRVDSNTFTSKAIPPDQLQDKSDRYYYTETTTKKKGEFYVSPLDLNREGDPPRVEVPYRPVIRYATPIFDVNNDELFGMVILNVFGDEVLNSFHGVSGTAETDEQENETELLLDDEGYYLEHPDITKEWGGPADLNTGESYFSDMPEIAPRVLSGEADSFLYQDDIVAHAPVFPDPADTNRFWMVVEEVPQAVLLAPVDSLRTVVLVATIGLVVLIVLIAYTVSRSITSPITRLQLGANIIAGGDLNYRVGTKAGDEVGKLSRAFDEMTVAIKKSRASIDRKVREQTRSIRRQRDKLETQQAAMLNVLEDIEQEKERSLKLAGDLEKFKLAADNVTDQVVITDAEGGIIYANKATEVITGYPIKDLIGKKAGAPYLWGGLMGNAFYKKFWDTIKEKKKSFIGQIRNKRRNGQEYDALVSVAPILDKQKNVQFFVGIERDITKEKEIDRAKTEFVSLASHQLRTPLSAINWYTEMLLAGDAGKINKTQKQYLDEIYTGNQRMVGLVNALLNVSRLELGTFAIEPEPTDILKVSRSVLDELKPSIDEKNLTLSVPRGAKIPIMNVDPKLIRIVFQNLLSNAVKYTPAKGTIGVTMAVKKKGAAFDGKQLRKDSIAITIHDTGFGIPEEQHDKIFTKLFRADNVREQDTEGTGLGLYIVKAIIEQTGGRIWFTSQENKGTTFYFTLPLHGMKKKEGSKELSPG